MTILPKTKIDQIASIISSGGVCAIPTDTVYGLASLPTDNTAINELLTLKGRPEAQPIAVLFDELSSISQYLISSEILTHVQNYWPGAFTAVVQVHETAGFVFPVITETNTIGIRQPDNDLTKKILSLCGGVLAVSSANIHGSEPARNADEVEKMFGKKLVVLDGGSLNESDPSTVVDLTSYPYKILRQGPIDLSDLQIE